MLDGRLYGREKKNARWWKQIDQVGQGGFQLKERIHEYNLSHRVVLLKKIDDFRKKDGS